MASLAAYYLPPDRLRAVAAGVQLPLTAEGSALFADISGFTPITERLRATLGARRGSEELAVHLNRVYDALIIQVEQYGGSIIGFAGDAITCWFSGEASEVRATACGFALLKAMDAVEQIMLTDDEYLLLGLKVAITSGTTKRFVVGDPAVQLIDALAGTVIARMAAGEELAERDELLADAPTVERLGESAKVREWRGSGNERFAVLEPIETVPDVLPVVLEHITPPDEMLLPWMLPALARHLKAGLGEFQIELRLVTAVFLCFSGIHYDEDPEAENQLNQFMRMVQTIVSGYEGNLLQLTIGDKGSYVYAAFGAPFAHEDDAARALNAALDIREKATSLGYLDPVQIGISRGIVRTGAYGSSSRRTYGVLGDEVNLAARLMAKAAPGEILVSETLSGAVREDFVHEVLPPIVVKGKASPIGLFRLLEARDRSFAERFYTTPLIGRDDAFITLKNALQPIFEGRHAGIIFVHGEPGMGKSRLAFEVQGQLQRDDQNVTWLTGQADALNRTPLSAFAYFLRPYFGQRRDQDRVANMTAFDAAFESVLAVADETNQTELNLYRSYLAGILGLIIPGSPYESAEARTQIDNGIAAIKAWVRAEARRQPLILHLEDSHWLDTSSISAVQQLTYNMENLPLALLLTSRYKDDGSLYTIPNLYSVPVHSIDLNKLSDEGVRTVAGAILQGSISDQLAHFIQQQAEGNPFFTEQLALDLKERSALTQQGDEWTLRPESTAEVPSGINAVLIARLDRLAAQVKSVVQTAAVLGREFELEVLSRMLREADTPAIRDAEREAIWSALSELSYLFRHALLRDAAYDMQAQERLKTLHRLAAETIETLYPEDQTQNDVLMEHWRLAGDPVKELQYLVPVIRRLVNVSAEFARAKVLVQRGLLISDPDSSQRAIFLNLLSYAENATGNRTAATQAARKAQEIAEQHGDWETYLLSLSNSADAAFSQTDLSAAQDSYQQLLVQAQKYGSKGRFADALNGLAIVAATQSNFSQAGNYWRQYLAIVQELDDVRRMCICLNNMGMAEADQDNYVLADDYLQQSLVLAIQIGYKNGIVNRLQNLGTIASRRWDNAVATDYWRRTMTLAQEIGSLPNIAGLFTNLAMIAVRERDYAAANDYVQQGLALGRNINSALEILRALEILSKIAMALGKYDEAYRHYTEALALAREKKIALQITINLNGLGGLTVHSGAFEEARHLLDEALSISRSIQSNLNLAYSLLFHGKLAITEGNYEEALAHLTEGMAVIPRMGDRRATADMMNANGWLAFYQGQYDTAETFFLESLAKYPQLSARAGLVRVYLKLRRDEAVKKEMQEGLRFMRPQIEPYEKLEFLVAAADMYFINARDNDAAEMIGLILGYPNVGYQTRLDAEQVYRELAVGKDSSVLEAALERGKSLDLDGVVARLLAELV